MKSIPPFFFFIAVALAGYAQSNYNPGYIITNEADTIVGLIDYRTDKMNAKVCKFKMNQTSNEQIYHPGDIAGYRFVDDGKFYVTHDIEIESIKHTVFLEYLI